MRVLLEHILPVGAPWGGPESFKFLSCFASLYMGLEKEKSVTTLYCDRDIRVCDGCNECGEMVWARKCHEQIYHDFLTLSGLACHTLWPADPTRLDQLCSPAAFTDDTYLRRTLDYAGYTHRLLTGAGESEIKAAVQGSIDRGVPVMAQNLVNADWCLVTGYEAGGDILLGSYTAEAGDDPSRAPQRLENGLFFKEAWHHPGLQILLVESKKAAPALEAGIFSFLRGVLRQPGNARATAGLTAYTACQATLLDERSIDAAAKTELEQLYTLTHAWVGSLAEARCFGAFAFWTGFFGRVRQESALAKMKEIGDAFMDTHNQCWKAWALMGKDHHCQPELYLDTFKGAAVRQKLAGYIHIFRANDEKAIRLLETLAVF
jgi:hypothetical protein